MQVVQVSRNKWDYFVETREVGLVRAVSPQMKALASVPDSRCVAVTACGHFDGGPSFDFVSRVFGPAVGVDEDPVTGTPPIALCKIIDVTVRTQARPIVALRRIGVNDSTRTSSSHTKHPSAVHRFDPQSLAWFLT